MKKKAAKQLNPHAPEKVAALVATGATVFAPGTRPAELPSSTGLEQVEAALGSHHRILVPVGDAEPTAEQRRLMATRAQEFVTQTGGYVRDVNPTEVQRAFQQNLKDEDQRLAAQQRELEAKTREEARRRKAAAAAREQAKEKFNSSTHRSSTTKTKETSMSTKKAKTTTSKPAAPSALARSATEAGGVTTAAKKAAVNRSTSVKEFAGFAPDAKIKVLVKESGFHEGSIRDQVFKKLLRCATVADAKKVSSDPWHLRTAVKSKKLKVG